MLPRVLLVDTRQNFVDRLQSAWAPFGDVQTTVDFEVARDVLRHNPPSLLVTNLRLAAFNGLHLIHLAAVAGPVRSVIYSERPDAWLLREAQELGAFFEWSTRLHAAIPSYIGSTLPPVDRRNAEVPERRLSYRGGRRAADVLLLELA
jgi:hypothetical protein